MRDQQLNQGRAEREQVETEQQAPQREAGRGVAEKARPLAEGRAGRDRTDPSTAAPEPKIQGAPALPKLLRIQSVRREKFQNRDNYEEIRLLRIQLKRRKSVGVITGDGLRVEVVFYDKDPAAGEVFISHVPAPRKGLELKEAWDIGETKSFSALYMVPDAYRRDERERTNRSLQFYGYIVRVYYDKILQDAYSFPATLLQRFP